MFAACAAAIGASVDWLANFLIIEAFPTLNQRFGLAWVMVGFAFLAVLVIAFIARYVPETKGLSLEKVIAVFDRQAGAKRSSGWGRKITGDLALPSQRECGRLAHRPAAPHLRPPAGPVLVTHWG